MVTGVLTVIGDLVEDVVVWPVGARRRGTDNPAVVRRARGGSAANVAAMAAPLVATRFIGRVGDDAVGTGLAEALARLGVDVRVQRGGRTGTVVVLVDADGERTMYPDRGAGAELADVPDAWLDGTAVLHVPAYGFAAEPCASSVRDAIGSARDLGARLTVDVSATSLMEHYGLDAFRALLDDLRPEIVFANGEEAASLGLLDGVAVPPRGCAWVVKDGPRPATVVRDDGATTSVAAIAVDDVRDTTGAGDAFAAGFLAAWMGGAALDDACRAGHLVAASILSRPGAGGQSTPTAGS